MPSDSQSITPQIIAPNAWTEAFAQERTRLLAALGELIAGGVVEKIQHVGSTSVPGLMAQPRIDILLVIEPFPLDAARQAAIEALGYRRVEGSDERLGQQFLHNTGTFRLYLVGIEGGAWTNFVAVRDYLRHSAEARQAYATFKASNGKEATAKQCYLQELTQAARTWWVDFHGFAPVQAVAQELAGLAAPWYISSGWALDLFLGRATRIHEDIDVVIARHDQLLLQSHMVERGWKFLTPLDGRLEPWPLHMRIDGPRHQAHAHRDGAFIDFLLSPIEHGIWYYRRNPIVVRTLDRMSVQSELGIRCLAPELVLLFKSKNTSRVERSKDYDDFEKVYPMLDPERRAWLRWALQATDPQNPWIERLKE